MGWWSTALLAFSLAGLAHAFHSFEPTCSSPPEDANFVFSAQTRGTMDIVWIACSALLLCTWAIQHLSVPDHIVREKSSWNTAFKEKFKFNLRKINWMGITLLGPEFVLGKALAENLAAHYSKRQFGHKNWTSTHAFFANMRGFILRFDIAAVQTSLTPTSPEELGRSRQRPRAHNDAPYYEQDVGGAVAIEIEQCRTICLGRCGNRPGLATLKKSDSVEVSGNESSKAREQNNSKTSEERDKVALSVTEKTGSNEIESLENSERSAEEATKKTKESTSKRSLEITVSEKSSTTKIDRDLRIAGKGSMEFEKSQTILQQTPELGPHEPWKATWALNASQIYHAYDTGIISALPPIMAEEISDRSKGDGLVKTAAVFQLVWLITQIIARSCEGLATTLIEVTVLAFAACSIVTYGFLWYKPQDVKIPVYIDVPGLLTREQIIGLAARSPPSSMIVHEFWLHGVAIRAMADNIFPYSPGIKVKFSWMKQPIFFSPVVVGIGLGGALFGAIHFLAWNFHFPTPVERLLWRISCVLLVVLPVIGTIMYWATQHYAREWGENDTKINRVLKPLGYLFMPFYIFARFYLMVEVFRSLAYLPTSAYKQVQWPSLVPHVS